MTHENFLYGLANFFQGVYTIVTNAYDTADGKFDHFGAYIVEQQAFWFSLGMSVW